MRISDWSSYLCSSDLRRDSQSRSSSRQARVRSHDGDDKDRHRGHRSSVERLTSGHRRFPVGAGLLAKAVGRLGLILNVPPSSRASPLPKEFAMAYKSETNTTP